MTREEFLDLKRKVDSGEIDYDAIPRDVRREYKSWNLQRMKEEADKDVLFVTMFGKATDESNPKIYSQKDVPQYTTHSRVPIIYDKKNKGAKKAAKEIEKKREKAIEKTAKKYTKRQKKERKKLKKKEAKKAKKIFKRLTRDEQYAYLMYAEENSERKMIKKIIFDAQQKEEEEREIAKWWASWASFHEFDQKNKEDVRILQAAVDYEESPTEKFMRRKRNDPDGDKSKVFGKYLQPFIPMDEKEEDFYANSVTIKSYDWKEFSKYLSKKKIKKPSDIVKYRRKFNWKKLMANYKTIKSTNRTITKKRRDQYMYTPLECRDLVGVQEYLERQKKLRECERERKAELMEFVKGKIDKNHTFFKCMKNHDHVLDDMLKAAQDAFDSFHGTKEGPEEPMETYTLIPDMTQPLSF